MKNFYRRSRLRLLLACLLIGGGLPSCSDSEEGGNPGYRPDQPIVLESFYPTTGSIATQVIIKGKNFGTDPKALNVYFNEKRAAVISATGERMLVLAPKLPGEECIISVSMGENEENKTQFDEIFNYIIQTNVSTVAGGTQGSSMPTGTTSLSSVASFMDKPDSPIAIDKDNNIYVRFSLSSEENVHRVYMMNEEAGSIKLAYDFGIFLSSIILAQNCQTGEVYFWQSNMGNNDYGYFDPAADYAGVTSGQIVWDSKLPYTDGMPCWGGRSGFAMNPGDGKFYFYSNEGACGRFDPQTGAGENLSSEVFKTSQGDIMGIGLRPPRHEHRLLRRTGAALHLQARHRRRNGRAVGRTAEPAGLPGRTAHRGAVQQPVPDVRRSRRRGHLCGRPREPLHPQDHPLERLCLHLRRNPAHLGIPERPRRHGSVQQADRPDRQFRG